MDSKLIIMLIGISVILCLVMLNTLFIYFIIDSPYKAKTPPKTMTTSTTTTTTQSTEALSTTEEEVEYVDDSKLIINELPSEV